MTTLNETNKKVEEACLQLADYEANKRMATSENADQLRQLQVIFMKLNNRSSS